jgi:predicted Zn-dependent protease
MRKGQERHALKLIEGLIKKNPLSPYLHVMRAELILLQNHPNTPPLDAAERSYLRAHNMNPNDLEAIEGLAHFYDAVNPDRRKAKKFAELYLQKSFVAIRKLRKLT